MTPEIPEMYHPDYVIQLPRWAAIALGKSGWWKNLPARDVVRFQLFVKGGRLCMDFGDFQDAVEDVLGRPVMTVEFGPGWPRLQREFLGQVPPPTVKEVLDLIPETRMVVFPPRGQP